MMLQVIVRVFNGLSWSEIETIDIQNMGAANATKHSYDVKRWNNLVLKEPEKVKVLHCRDDGALTLVRKALEGLGQ